MCHHCIVGSVFCVYSWPLQHGIVGTVHCVCSWPLQHSIVGTVRCVYSWPLQCSTVLSTSSSSSFSPSPLHTGSPTPTSLRDSSNSRWADISLLSPTGRSGLRLPPQHQSRSSLPAWGESYSSVLHCDPELILQHGTVAACTLGMQC